MHRHLEYPTCSLYDYLSQTAEKYPAYTALNYFGRRITFSQLDSKIAECAAALSAAGVKAGDSVSVCLPNIPEAVFLFYAINRVGAVANMIHPMSAENEIIRYLELTESKYLFAVDLIAKKVRCVARKVPLQCTVAVSVSEGMPLLTKGGYALKMIGKSPDLNGLMTWKQFIGGAKKCRKTPNAHAAAEDCAAILYSGGTTGKPKGIMLTNYNFNALAVHSIDACGGLSPADKMLSVMPIFHGFGLGVCIHTILTLGGTAVIQPKFSVKNFHKLLFRYRPNIIAGVPAIYEGMLVSRQFDGKDLSFLKCIISGGDSLSPSTKKKLNAMLESHGCKTHVREGYGLTECVTGSCLMPDHSDNLISVGLPYADTFYQIIDRGTDRVLPAGETGEIILRGPSVMKGYYKEPEETAEVLRRRDDGHIWLYTGDLGYMDEDGFVYFRQRRKRMIVSGGYNIYPQNIEEVINRHPQIVMCAVVGVPDRILGEKVRAFAVPAKDADTDKLREELMKSLRKEIAAYALPREIRFVEELPKTLVGKIAYTELTAEK